MSNHDLPDGPVWPTVLEDLEAAQSQEEIDAVLQRLDWGRVQRLSGETI